MAYKYPCHLPGESSVSYLLRFSRANQLSPIGALNRIYQRKREFEYQNSHIIIFRDFLSLYLLNKLPGTTDNQVINTFKNMTFQPVIEKFIDKEVVGNKFTFLRGIISHKLRYCPRCVLENGYYKLFWQINEVSVCLEHKLLLKEKCPRCNMPIPLVTSNSQVGFCSYCGMKLGIHENHPTYDELDYIRNQRIFSDWEALFSENSVHPIVEGKTVCQSIVVGLLYLLTGGKHNYDSLSRVDRNLLMHIRGKGPSYNSVHLQKVLDTIRKSNLTIPAFASLDIPRSFVDFIETPFAYRRLRNSVNLESMDIEQLLRDNILRRLNSYERISVCSVADELGISIDKLKCLGLIPSIKSAINEQKERKHTMIKERVKKFFDELSNCNKEVSWSDVSKAIHVKRNSLEKTNPDLYNYIRCKINKHNKTIRENKIARYLNITSATVKERNMHNLGTSLNDVANAIGVSRKYLETYPEVMEFLKIHRI